MNAQQRKEIAALSSKLGSFDGSAEMQVVDVAYLKVQDALAEYAAAREAASSKLEEIKEDIDSQATEEQDKFDNMPESLQGGERGQAMEGAIEHLNNAVDELDAAIEKLRDEEAISDDDVEQVANRISEAVEALDQVA